MQIRNGTCIDCGNAEHECECSGREEANLESKIERVRLGFMEKGYCSCFDCLGYTSPYMLHNKTWQRLMPEHDHVRKVLLDWHRRTYPQHYREVAKGPTQRIHGTPITSIRLCLGCAQKRLGRPLILGDFTDVPLNASIHFAHRMGTQRPGIARKQAVLQST